MPHYIFIQIKVSIGMEWCRSKLGIQRSFEGEQAVRFIPGEELSYINLIDIALKQCID